jgi:hypothetical protein
MKTIKTLVRTLAMIEYKPKAIHSPADFLKGQLDCKEGKPAATKASQDYTRGYAAQYQHEQNIEYFSRGH